MRVSLDSTPQAQRALLKPGMEIHASGKATLVPKTILIPSDTLLSDAEGSYVWLVENGTVRRRRLKSGYVNGPQTEIVSGLKQGEKVILTGKEGLTEGQAVEAQ